jgi:hypothetical protein
MQFFGKISPEEFKRDILITCCRCCFHCLHNWTTSTQKIKKIVKQTEIFGNYVTLIIVTAIEDLSSIISIIWSSIFSTLLLSLLCDFLKNSETSQQQMIQGRGFYVVSYLLEKVRFNICKCEYIIFAPPPYGCSTT